MWDAYNHYMPPNSTACAALNDFNVNPIGGGSISTATYGGWGTFMDALPPSCNHPGGVNIAFADGSVRWVKNSVTPQTWWALGTRNGQEALSSDAY
jgi:prepilin-type processing-associated H-X9-DG protein